MTHAIALNILIKIPTYVHLSLLEPARMFTALLPPTE
jgi:hypothetical protein